MVKLTIFELSNENVTTEKFMSKKKMSSVEINSDFKTIIVKNLPKTIKNYDEYFRKNYGAIATRLYGRQRIILRYDNEHLARTRLYQLHQHEIDGKILSAEFLGIRKLNKSIEIEEESCDNYLEKIPDYVKNLFATSSAHGFDKPPPSNLKYSYPKINRDILDSISIALMSNTKFYTQVLHLMNRMNLEPPFLPRKSKFIVLPGELKNAQTQTDIDKGLLASDESELETENEDDDPMKYLNYKNLPKRKRKFLDETGNIKKKAKKILKSTIQNKNLALISRQGETLSNIFEQNNKVLIDKRISMNVSQFKLPEKSESVLSDELNENIIESVAKVNEVIDTKTKLRIDDLKLNRIPENQLKELPVYRNYTKGERTNKLYIKNLNKDVTELELKNIYNIFRKSSDDDPEFGLDIKVMQHGRMKGQAFVTFLNVNDNKMDFIETALNETNGYILKNKPMIVCFGKKDKNKA